MATRSVRPRNNPAKPAVVKVAINPEKKLKKKAVEGKTKVVRDSFSMPQADYALIAELKIKVQESGFHVKKSELLRAGLRMLAKANLTQLKRACAEVEKIKTGRPKKN